MKHYNVWLKIALLFFPSINAAESKVAAGAKFVAEAGCGGKPADVIFLLDSSRSIWGPDFSKQLDFVRSVVSHFDIGRDKTRVGVITFSNSATVHVSLDRYNTKVSLQDAISKIKQANGGSTMTDMALVKAREMMSSEGRSHVPKLVVVLTDGESTYPEVTSEEAVVSHQAGLATFAIGVGDRINPNELKTIASKAEYYFTVDNYSALQTLKEILAIKACEVQADSPKIVPTTTTTMAVTDLLAKGCGGKPADIVFVLDASGSIWAPDFQKQLKFVEDIVGVFDISPSMTRIGVMTFSSHPRREFFLDTYETEKEVKEAISKISQTRGTTQTAKALRSLTKHYFSRAQSRQGAVKLAVIITDGKSENPAATLRQASLVRKAGINVFALGVGKAADHDELTNIAGREDRVFKADNYDALHSIRDILAIETCKVTEPPAQPIDIMFALPSAAAKGPSAMTMRFVRDVTSGLELGNGNVQMGLAPRSCYSVAGIDLSENVPDRDEMLSRFQAAWTQRSQTASTIKHLRNVSFKKGANVHAKKVAVMVVDADSPNYDDTAKEAFKAQSQDGIEMFVVAVGNSVSKSEMTAIASKPVRKHVFIVSGYDKLHLAQEKLIESITRVSKGTL